MRPETKREILIAREAFIEGARWNSGGYARSAVEAAAAKEIAKQYPLPKITRLRIVVDSTRVNWRIRENSIEVLEDDWRTIGLNNKAKYIITNERAAIFHDLFTHPTEEIEDV